MTRPTGQVQKERDAQPGEAGRLTVPLIVVGPVWAVQPSFGLRPTV